MEYAKRTAADAEAGDLMRCACRRFLADLEREELEFRPRAVERCLTVVRALKHYKSEFFGMNFEPEPWQEFIVANIVGFYWRASGRRRYRRAYIEISRKNGKSFLVNALAIYFLLFDGEASPEVIVGANSREQAKAVDFEMLSQFARQLDPRGRQLEIFRDEIKVPSITGRLKVIGADTKTTDGYNPSVGIIDEYHAAPNSQMHDVIVSGMGMRRNPLLFVITTAGFNKECPCYRLRETCVDILHGVKEDDASFAVIFAMDADDDWKDPAAWRRANPNLGVTVSEEYLREQVASAVNNPAEEVSVRTKNLNEWCDAAMVWVPDAYVSRAMAKTDRAALAGRICFVGVDLSAVSDLTAVSYLFPRADGLMHFFTDYYLPQSALSDKFNKELYRQWWRMGFLKLTDGNVTDYDAICADMQRNAALYEILCIGYDKWNATQWAIKMTEAGYPLEEFGQTIGNFSRPTKELERLMLSGNAAVEYSPITRFCFRNVNIKEDWNENRKPVKASAAQKIDGVIAMLTALGVSQADHFIGMTNLV